ncbi:MAG: rhamnan synthesis F family protein [Rhodanobacter sp.]
MRKLAAMVGLVRDVVDRHGGGWAGACSVAARTFRVIRALGWKGLTQRIRASRQPQSGAISSPDLVEFPPASPPGRLDLSVGIMIHAFYADLLDELANDVARMPVPFVLMISVVDEQAREAALSRFGTIPSVQALHVRIVPNRGRDIAPLLLNFRDEILALDLVCHLHTKKSLYSGKEQGTWRRYLIDALLGSRDRVAWILGMFQAMPRLGMIYPESFASVPWWAHTWLSNAGCARELGARLGIGIDSTAYLDYPAGSMFWARTHALRPLYELELPLDAFPLERGQTDGTTQHVVERMLGLIVRHRGMVLGILPADGSNSLRSEGERNWTSYFSAPVAHKIGFAAIDARIVSFDLFDTLVWRPFLHPSGSRNYLAVLVEKEFGLADFSALRTRAETMARAKHGRDVGCEAIYEAMARLPELHGMPVAAIREFELATEKHLLKPRPAVVEAAQALVRSGKRVVAVSDMYFDAGELVRTLPAPVSAVVRKIHVSCENGWRKDTGEAWQHLPRTEHVPPGEWLHVGDNEHADVQLPQAMGFIHPVHVLRSGALLDVVPALRSLRPKPAQLDRWQDQLWLGMVANHFNELADRRPGAFGPQLVIEAPETLGYTVLGPLLLDYSTWLARLAREHHVSRVLFLSREGYLLQHAFRKVQLASPDIGSIQAQYLLVSRRGMNTPSLHDIADLAEVFAAPYTGPLENLLNARLGARVAAAAARQLGKSAIAGEVYLPDMGARVIDLLRPAAATILGIAREERDAYLQYWASLEGDGSAIVADVGYAGTIQTRLSKLTGQALGGAYFAASQAMEQVSATRGWAHARFHDARGNGASESPVMQYHLLLEAILTSPYGQFSHFESGHEGPIPVHFHNAVSRSTWNVIERIHAGALGFVDDVCGVTGASTTDLAFSSSHVQEPLRCVGSGLWRLGSWADALRVEDNYTGRGEVGTSNSA